MKLFLFETILIFISMLLFYLGYIIGHIRASESLNKTREEFALDELGRMRSAIYLNVTQLSEKERALELPVAVIVDAVNNVYTSIADNLHTRSEPTLLGSKHHG